MPEIRRVVLFGSLARGEARVHSDSDLLVELASSTLAPRDRIPSILASLSPVRLPVDLFVYTSDELRDPVGVARLALQEGFDLLEPERPAVAGADLAEN